MRWPFLILVLFGAATLATLQPVAQVVAKQEKKEEPKFDPASRGTGFKMPSEAKLQAAHAAAFKAHGYRVQALATNATPPATFDCVSLGWVGPMWDQGSCGSCYLVSTRKQETCAGIKAGYGKADGSFIVSAQEGMDCHNFGGCDGGWGYEVATSDVKTGVPLERWVEAGVQKTGYPPYTARSQQCRDSSTYKHVTPKSIGYCTSDQSSRQATTAEIKACMMQYGVINVALDAGGAFGNTNGTTVIKSLGRSINHEINIVGWDDSKNAWKVMNQWGTSWGDGGYAWIDYGAYMVEHFWVSFDPVVPPVVLAVTVQPSAGQPNASTPIVAVATGGTAPYGWKFDYGDGTTGTVPTHTYANVGTYNVTATATDAAGAVGTASGVVTISKDIPPKPDAGPVTSVTMTFKDGSTQTLPLPNSISVTPTTTVADLIRAMTEREKDVLPPLVPVVPAPDPRWNEQQKINEKILDRLEWLQKQLTPTKL